MSSIGKIQTSHEKAKHNSELKRLQQKNQNEIATIKENHKTAKQQTVAQNKAELQLRDLQHRNKLISQSIKNEEILNKVKKSLDDVKVQVNSEMEEVISESEKRKQLLRQKESLELTHSKEELNRQLEQSNQDFSLQSQALEKKKQIQAQILKEQNLNNKNEIIGKGKEDVQGIKNEYIQKTNSLSEKYNGALLDKQVAFEKRIVENERKHINSVEQKSQIYKNTEEKLLNNHSKKLKTVNENFEEKYSTTFKKQSDLLQNLVGKKEKLIHKLKGTLLKEYKLGLEKQDDIFYQPGRLQANITANDQDNGYIIEIPVKEHEAKNIILKADKRNITIAFNRRLEMQSETPDGVENEVKKYENYESTYKVDNIIEANSLSRSYADGMLTFKLDYA